MSDFESALQGDCEDCGAFTARLVEDPYPAELYDEIVLVYLCDDCLQQHIWDI